MDVTDLTIDTNVIQRSYRHPVVVDFWAEWCGPCKALTPVLESEIAARAGKVSLAKVDVDSNPTVASHLGITGIPAVKAFRNGEIVSEFTGAQPAQVVGEFLDQLIGATNGAVDDADEQAETEEEAEDVDPVIDVLQEAGDFPEVLGPLAEGDYERAFEWLLGQVPGADEDRRDRIREVMVLLFAEVGVEDSLTVRYRRRLATTLY